MSRTNDLYALGKHTMCPSQIDKMSKQGGYRYLVFISIRLFCFIKAGEKRSIKSRLYRFIKTESFD